MARGLTALCVGAAVALASWATPAVDAAACGKVPFVPLPTTLGLDTCVGNHKLDLFKIAAGATFQCSAVDLWRISKSAPLQNFGGLLKRIAAAPEKISATLYEHMRVTRDAEMDAFCADWSKLVTPCANALLPKFLAMVNGDDACCGQISDVVDMLNLFVPPNVSKESFLLTELVNGVNSFFCARREDTRRTCGATLYEQVTATYSAAEFRLLDSFLMPFVTASVGEECAAFQGQPFTNAASLQPAKAIDYGCCVNHMRPLLETIRDAISHLTGSSPIEFLNGAVEFPAEGLQFLDALKNAKQCKYKSKCSAPNGLMSYAPRFITPGTNNPRKNELKDTNCKRVKKCDASGKLCSEVCEKDSLRLTPWVAKSLQYQRELAYKGPMCYAQIPSTHNSAINLADGFGNRDQLMNANLSPRKPYSYLKTNNHVLGLVDQLNAGARWLEVDTHYFLDEIRSGHCGNLGSRSIQVLAQVFKEQLAKYGEVMWIAELLGCFPSLSGIRADEQPKTRDSMKEIRAWLNKPENKDEFVVLYFDNGPELKDFNKFGQLNELLVDIFGELIVPISELEALSANNWEGTFQDFINVGRRVLLIANDNTGLAYGLSEFCRGHQILRTQFINDLPDAARTIGGKKIYGNEYFLRSYQAVLRYISVSDTAKLTHQLPLELDTANIGKYVRWNLNLVATDRLDGALAKAQIWSWAENEPSLPRATTVIQAADGRWRSAKSTPSKKACWNGTSLQWAIVDYSTECTEGATFTAPRDPYQNFLLQQELLAKGIPVPVAINV